jgi:hypothetical protein
MARLKRDLASLDEEVAVSTRPGTRSPLSEAERRSLKADLQGLIQKLDELAGKLST